MVQLFSGVNCVGLSGFGVLSLLRILMKSVIFGHFVSFWLKCVLCGVYGCNCFTVAGLRF